MVGTVGIPVPITNKVNIYMYVYILYIILYNII